MRHYRSRVTLVFALALLSTDGLRAFADNGHRIVGQIAEAHLQNSRAMSETRKILGPRETLADASVWPDTIKNPIYEDGDTAPFRLEHPGHDVYHYANLPFQSSRYDAAVPGARPLDIVQITRECIRVLRGSSTFFTRREALRFLAHLVGDIHQPMHVGTGFVAAEGPLRFVLPQGSTGWRVTLGGNALVYGPQDRFNLHSYWDAHAVNLAMRRDDAKTAAARLVQELPLDAGWRNTGDIETWPETWANEGLDYAEAAHAGVKILAYLGPDESGRTAHRWRIQQPSGYDEKSQVIVRLQLAKAGYRLSATLRAIWPDPAR
jgi:hypothetical protein